MVRRKRPSTTRRAVGYVRCSTSKQDLSPDAQHQAISSWAEREGVELVSVHEDRGVGGDTDIADRPGLTAALVALSRGYVLIAARLDRFARDAFVIGSIERQAQKAGARVVTCDGATNDPLRRDLDVLISAHERRLIRQRTRDALAVKKAKGERMGNVAYGYRLAPDGVHVEQHPDEQAVIARARALDASGMSLRAITKALNDAGLRNRRGQPFAFQSVHKLLTQQPATEST